MVESQHEIKRLNTQTLTNFFLCAIDELELTYTAIDRWARPHLCSHRWARAHISDIDEPELTYEPCAS